jgi:hypothetical protein
LGETQEHCVASKMEIEGLCSTILFTVWECAKLNSPCISPYIGGKSIKKSKGLMSTDSR